MVSPCIELILEMGGAEIWHERSARPVVSPWEGDGMEVYLFLRAVLSHTFVLVFDCYRIAAPWSGIAAWYDCCQVSYINLGM